MSKSNTTNPLKGDEIEKEAAEHAKRVIALGWHKNNIEQVIAGAWEAGYIFGGIDASETPEPSKSLIDFLKKYYDWDENELEPQDSFASVSLSDLSQLISEWEGSKESNTDCSVEQAANEYAEKKEIDRWVFTPENIKRNSVDDFIAGAKWSSQLKPVDCDYWKKRCEAAEFLLGHVDNNINKRFVGYKEWENLKATPPNTEQL